MHKKVKATTG